MKQFTRFFSKKIREYRWTIAGCTLGGGVAHCFALNNILQNYDNIYVNPIGYGTGIQSGRWLLSVLGNISEILGFGYNLPFWNGFLTILLLTVAAVLITDLFHLRDCYAFLFGTVFLSFPTVTSTLFFMYTAPWYALAVLWAIMAVWCAEKGRSGIAVAIGLEAASLGIYQAYIPMTAVLFVCLLILKEFNGCYVGWKDFVKRTFYYLVILAGGFVLYFLCLKILLSISHTQLTSYVNIDEMGQIEFHDIPNIIKRCYVAFYRLPLHDYYGVAPTNIIKFCILLIGIAVPGILICVWRRGGGHATGFIRSLFLYFAVYPVALNSIEVICFNSRIYVLMIYSVVFLYLLPLVLLNTMEGQRPIWKTEAEIGSRGMRWFRFMVVSALIAVALNYIYLSNVNYTAAYYLNQETANYLNRFIMRVQEAEGYDVSYPWAFIGDRFEDPSFTSPWNVETQYGGFTDGNLINAYSRDEYIKKYLGLSYETVDDYTLEKLKKDSTIQKMPCYPNAGSIWVRGDVVIIKLCEE